MLLNRSGVFNLHERKAARRLRLTSFPNIGLRSLGSFAGFCTGVNKSLPWRPVPSNERGRVDKGNQAVQTLLSTAKESKGGGCQ